MIGPHPGLNLWSAPTWLGQQSSWNTEREQKLPIILHGRVMSVGLKAAQAETKDRAAKEELVEVEIYVARQRMEIVQAPASLLGPLQDLEGEEVAIECQTYTPWAVGNKVGISFKYGQALDENFKPMPLGRDRKASLAVPAASAQPPPRQPVQA